MTPLKEIATNKVFSKRELLLYAALLWSFVRYSFINSEKNFWHVIHIIGSLTYYIDPLITVLIAGGFIYSLSFYKIYRPVYILFLLLLFAFFLSWSANSDLIKMSNALKFFIGYFKFIFLFLYATLLYQDHVRIIGRLLKITLALLFFQIVVHFTWLLDLQIFGNPKILIPNNKDWAYGTMENTHMLALAFIILFAYAVFKVFYGTGSKWKYILLLVLAALQVVLAESKANFLLISISLIIALYFMLDTKKFVMSTVIVLLVFVVFIGASIVVYSASSHFGYGGVFETLQGLTHVIEKSLEFNYKLIFINQLLTEIPSDQFFWPFGSGPGVLGSNFALENPTRMSARYFLPLVEGNFNFGNSVLTSARTGYTAVYADLGPVGFIIYFGLYSHIIAVISKSLKRNRHQITTITLAKFIWLALSINYLLNQFLVDSLYVGAPLFLIWTMGALLYYDATLDTSPEGLPHPQHQSKSQLS